MEEWEKGNGERKLANRLGFVGDRIDDFFSRQRGDTLMFVGLGNIAKDYGPFFLGIAENVTRLDLAVTLKDDDPERDWTQIALKQVQQDGRVQGGTLTTRRIEGTPDGKTLYVGHRSSERFIRIYDKTAQDPEAFPPQAWRWEIEYKPYLSGSVAKRLLTDGCTSRAILEHCKATFANLRITLPASGITASWTAHRPRRTTDGESRLKYTERVVAPFLKHLIESVGEDRVSQALARSLFTRDRLISQENGEILQ